MIHIAVMDFSNCSVNFYRTKKKIDDDNISIFLTEKGHKESECHWIYSNKLIINLT